MANTSWIPTIMSPEAMEAEALRREQKMRDAFRTVKSHYDYNYTDFARPYEPIYFDTDGPWWRRDINGLGKMHSRRVKGEPNPHGYGNVSDAVAFSFFMSKVLQKLKPMKGPRGDLRRAVEALQGSDALMVHPVTQEVVFNENYQSPFRKKFLNKPNNSAWK